MPSSYARACNSGVKFSIPNAPEDFDFTLMGSNGVNSIMHHSWILYGCRMDLK